MIHDFLPVCRADMEKRGWDQCDFVYVCGDAYVDHPSFGSAIISRVLESYGYKVGIIAQPDWKDKESVQVLGRPRLGFLVHISGAERRKYGFHGKPLFRLKETPRQGFLHAGRCYGKAAGLRGSGLLQPDPFRL